MTFIPEKKSEEHTWIRLEKPQELKHKNLLFEELVVEILSSPDSSSVGETEFVQVTPGDRTAFSSGCAVRNGCWEQTAFTGLCPDKYQWHLWVEDSVLNHKVTFSVLCKMYGHSEIRIKNKLQMTELQT